MTKAREGKRENLGANGVSNRESRVRGSGFRYSGEGA